MSNYKLVTIDQRFIAEVIARTGSEQLLEKASRNFVGLYNTEENWYIPLRAKRSLKAPKGSYYDTPFQTENSHFVRPALDFQKALFVPESYVIEINNTLPLEQSRLIFENQESIKTRFESYVLSFMDMPVESNDYRFSTVPLFPEGIKKVKQMQNEALINQVSDFLNVAAYETEVVVAGDNPRAEIRFPFYVDDYDVAVTKDWSPLDWEKMDTVIRGDIAVEFNLSDHEVFELLENTPLGEEADAWIERSLASQLDFATYNSETIVNSIAQKYDLEDLCVPSSSDDALAYDTELAMFIKANCKILPDFYDTEVPKELRQALNSFVLGKTSKESRYLDVFYNQSSARTEINPYDLEDFYIKQAKKELKELGVSKEPLEETEIEIRIADNATDIIDYRFFSEELDHEYADYIIDNIGILADYDEIRLSGAWVDDLTEGHSL